MRLVYRLYENCFGTKEKKRNKVNIQPHSVWTTTKKEEKPLKHQNLADFVLFTLTSFVTRLTNIIHTHI